MSFTDLVVEQGTPDDVDEAVAVVLADAACHRDCDSHPEPPLVRHSLLDGSHLTLDPHRGEEVDQGAVRSRNSSDRLPQGMVVGSLTNSSTTSRRVRYSASTSSTRKSSMTEALARARATPRAEPTVRAPRGRSVAAPRSSGQQSRRTGRRLLRAAPRRRQARCPLPPGTSGRSLNLLSPCVERTEDQGRDPRVVRQLVRPPAASSPVHDEDLSTSDGRGSQRSRRRQQTTCSSSTQAPLDATVPPAPNPARRATTPSTAPAARRCRGRRSTARGDDPQIRQTTTDRPRTTTSRSEDLEPTRSPTRRAPCSPPSRAPLNAQRTAAARPPRTGAAEGRTLHSSPVPLGLNLSPDRAAHMSALTARDPTPATASHP